MPIPSRRSRSTYPRKASLGPTGVKVAAGVAVVGVTAGGLVLGGWLRSGGGDVKGTPKGFQPAMVDEGDPRADYWPEYGRTAQRNRANDALKLDPPYRKVWTFDAGSLLEFPPAIAAGIAYVATNRGMAFAVRVSDGRMLWKHKLGGVVASSPSAVRGGENAVALFTTMAGDLVALNQHTGQLRWRLRLGSPIESSPLVSNGRVFVGTKDRRVVAVDVPTHRIVWTQKVPGDVKGSLAQSAANVVVGDYAGKVTALNRETGAVAWQTTSPGDNLKGSGRFYAGPAVAYGRVYIGNVNGRMLSLSGRDGSIVWVHGVDDYIYSSAAVNNRTVYVGSYDHHLYALDAVTGAELWKADLGERISGSPTVIGDLVWISTLAKKPRDGRNVAFNARTGEKVFTFPDGRYATPVGVKDRLVLTGVRTMYGLEPK